MRPSEPFLVKWASVRHNMLLKTWQWLFLQALLLITILKKILCNQIPNSCFAFFLPLSPCSLIDWLILEHSSSESSLSTPLFFQRTWFWMLSFIKFACQWIHNFSFLLTLYLILQLWGFLPIFPLSSVPSAKCSAYSLVLLVHISTI